MDRRAGLTAFWLTAAAVALAVVMGVLFATRTDFGPVAMPALILPAVLALLTGAALRRRCTGGSPASVTVAWGLVLLLATATVLGISFGGSYFWPVVALLAAAVAVTPGSPSAQEACSSR